MHYKTYFYTSCHFITQKNLIFATKPEKKKIYTTIHIAKVTMWWQNIRHKWRFHSKSKSTKHLLKVLLHLEKRWWHFSNIKKIKYVFITSVESDVILSYVRDERPSDKRSLQQLNYILYVCIVTYSGVGLGHLLNWVLLCVLLCICFFLHWLDIAHRGKVEISKSMFNPAAFCACPKSGASGIC